MHIVNFIILSIFFFYIFHADFTETEEICIKLYKSGAFIEACNVIFFTEIIEFDITNEEPARFKKSNYNSN